MIRFVVAALLLLSFATEAQAGGMFFGVRCGGGAGPIDAAKALNEKLEKLDGFVGTSHADLTILPVDAETTLACVVVNRDGQHVSREGDKARVHCQSHSPKEWADDGDGFYFQGEQRGLLTSLTLTKKGDQVVACALSIPKAE